MNDMLTLPIGPSPIRPLWPWSLNRASIQSHGLFWWYPVIPFPQANLRDFGRYHENATGVSIVTAGYQTSHEVGNYIEFDGANDRFDTTINAIDIPDLGDWGFGGWARPDDLATTGSNGWALPAFIGDDGGFIGILTGNRASGGNGFYWYNWDGTEDIVGPISGTEGEWVHLFWCVRGGSLRAYVNGLSVGSTTSGDTDTGWNIQIGRQATSGGNFQGGMADIRVYSPAPTDEVIYQMWSPITRWELQKSEVFPLAFSVPAVASSNLFQRMVTGVGG